MEHSKLKNILKRYIPKIDKIRLEYDTEEISLSITEKGYLSKKFSDSEYIANKYYNSLNNLIHKIYKYTTENNYFVGDINYLSVWEGGYSFGIRKFREGDYIITIYYGLPYVVSHLEEILVFINQNEYTSGLTKEDLINLLNWDYDKYKMVSELRK